MTPRERIPGVSEGQIYTYPSKCWRKKRRQYLSNFLQPHHKEVEVEVDTHVASVVEVPIAAVSEDSKESITVKEETVKVMKALLLFVYII
ncbi:hypothetical protein PR048_024044 [Dryococelus australis]|uniref:DPF1-3 N-terminal domain-containing protein n=1 Tax=Dryococelus australis TaxID=614101 RepID=A0ABQ9GVR8_9NEOP|nr:hypothetical protein PR048_024044 [Dryococelus australis]